MPTEAQRIRLQEIRATTEWANNYTDDMLILMMNKYPGFFDQEDVKWFVWGEDPITGEVIPAVSQWSQPVIGILLAAVAIFFVLQMK